MTITNLQDKLAHYADIAVKVGLNLQSGQRLMINAPLVAEDFVRRLAASAYQAGCRYVDVIWRDEQIELIRHQHAPRDSFEEYSLHRADGVLKNVQSGGAYMYVMGDDPDLLKDQDPDLVAVAEKSYRQHMKPVSDMLDRSEFNWLVISYPVVAWAEKVFPKVNSKAALEQLWQAIIHVCRVDHPDPVSAWTAHIAEIKARAAALTAKQYTALKYRAPGTDLTIGLADGHLWVGASQETKSGIAFTPNLPTEEVFTLPHCRRIDGIVTASKPLSRAGVLIEDFSLTFENGRITHIRAARGEQVLRKLIELDPGMASLGEVALVPHSSPIAQSGLLFYNTLLDENAASHIALGDGLNFCLQNGEYLPEEEYHARGGNTALNHVDFMIGSDQMDVDGVLPEGTIEPVMRSGEWAF